MLFPGVRAAATHSLPKPGTAPLFMGGGPRSGRGILFVRGDNPHFSLRRLTSGRPSDIALVQEQLENARTSSPTSLMLLGWHVEHSMTSKPAGITGLGPYAVAPGTPPPSYYTHLSRVSQHHPAGRLRATCCPFALKRPCCWCTPRPSQPAPWTCRCPMLRQTQGWFVVYHSPPPPHS